MRPPQPFYFGGEMPVEIRLLGCAMGLLLLGSALLFAVLVVLAPFFAVSRHAAGG